MDLVRLQQLHGEWALKNFPDSTPDHALIGMVEEVGELAHAHLKQIQKIRGTYEEHRAQKADAIGDILMYLLHYATLERFDMDSLVQKVWEDINKRDWLRNRVDGVSK